MSRSGVALSLRMLILIVLGMAVVAVVAMSFADRAINVGEIQRNHTDSSLVRSCEDNVQTYCTFHPGSDWSAEWSHCTDFRRIIDEDGDTVCPSLDSIG